MNRYFSLLILLIPLLVGCARPAILTPTASQTNNTPAPLYLAPEEIPVTDQSGTTIATQPGPQWVLVSGVDEHGEIASPTLLLLAEPDPDAPTVADLPTGTPAAIRQIRHTGPQGLQRFYQLELLDGRSGWISDFYIRRLAYLFLPESEIVPLLRSPGGQQAAQLPNVSPVILLDPTRPDWWLVQTPDGTATGWVPAGQVKESSLPQFLLNQPDNE